MVPKPTAAIDSALTRPTTIVSTRPIAIQPSSASTMGAAKRVMAVNSDCGTRLLFHFRVRVFNDERNGDSFRIQSRGSRDFWLRRSLRLGAGFKQSGAQRDLQLSPDARLDGWNGELRRDPQRRRHPDLRRQR